MKELTLRAGSVVCLPDIARQFGKDPAPAFAAAGLDQALIADPECRVSIVRLGKFAAEIAKLIDRPDLGLLVAKNIGQHSLGLVLILAQEGPNVRSFLRKMTQLLKHHNECAFLSLTELDGDAMLRYELREPDFEGADIVIAAALGHALRVMRRFCGETWCPSEVRFSMKRPRKVGPFEAYFEAPVRFESLLDELVFPSRWLDHPVTPLPARDGRGALPPSTWDFTDEVRHQIAMRISHAAVSAPIIAAAMGLSRRDLDRKLALHNTTFRTLADDVRFARARRLLGAANAPISDISLALGYAEPSAFSRAFRIWSGMSPQAWRKAHGESRSLPR
jgi:AraC-like DNA-binding protein